MATVTLDGVAFEIVQAKLRKWLELETIREKIFKAVEAPDEQASLVYQYISTALSVSTEALSKLPWRDVAQVLVDIFTTNTVLLDIPFIKNPPQKENKASWDYNDRNWWGLCHLIAKEFSWSIEYVSNMDVSEAMHIIQEIMIEEQLQKEWEWLLSERSAKYNESTKKYEPNPLPRPDWMRATPELPKKVKIRKEFMPVGVIVRGGKDGQTYDLAQ